MLNQDQHKLYIKIVNLIPNNVLATKNKAKSWQYGYNEKYDVVVISKSGKIGDIISVQGLRIALPELENDVYSRSKVSSEQHWEAQEIPKPLKKIKSIFQWHNAPSSFKNQWVDYIEQQFDYREKGYWFKNNGVATYVTGSHWMYLQHTKIDVGLPDFREANRIFYIHWEACKADRRSFGNDYLKIRRSGFSYMGSEE